MIGLIPLSPYCQFPLKRKVPSHDGEVQIRVGGKREGVATSEASA